MRMRTPEPTDRPAFNGWKIVRAGLVIQVLHSGLVFNSFSLFAAELHKTYGWTNSQLGFAFSMNRAESGLLGPLQGWMTDKWGPRAVLRVGAAIMAAGLVLFSRLDSLAEFYGFYLLVALGSSLAGFLSITVCIVNWFEQKRSRAIALSQTGFAIGGVAAFAVGASIHSIGWRTTSLVSAAIVLAVIVPLSRYFDRTPADVGQHIDGIDPLAAPAASADGENRAAPARPSAVHFTASEAMRTRAFWFISLGHASALLVVGAAMAHLAVYLEEERGLSPWHVSAVVGALPAMMGAGQLLGGYLGDRFDKRKVVTVAMGGHGIGLLVLAFASNPFMVWAFVLLHGLAWGLRGPLQQAMRADYFGATDFGKIMGFSSLVVMMGMVFGPIVAGVLADATGSFTLGFAILAVVAGLGGFWFWFATPPAPPTRSSTGTAIASPALDAAAVNVALPRP
ncbi:MAG: MFS transporter [Acidimicrobiia bacterium]|nr:MFS transporter [Acidimicrobiia bacterium]